MDFLVHVIKGKARCVGDTAHLSKHDGNRSNVRASLQSVRRIEVIKYMLDGVGQDSGAIDESHEAGDTGVSRVVEMEPQERFSGEAG
jgi:hypothetical protein